MQVTIRIHDDLRIRLEAQGANLKDYLRDRIKRRLRQRFGFAAADFLFVMEDRDKDGIGVSPHAHGSIGLFRCPIEDAPIEKRRLRAMAAAGQLAQAEILAGKFLLRGELKAAGGMGKGTPKVAKSGVNQIRNVWLREPKRPLFNHKWPTYAFKNIYRFSPVLGDRRLAISQPLIGKASLLWEIIRNGESAVP